MTAILVKHRRTLDNLNVSVKSTYFPGAWKSYAAKARERTKGKITKVTAKYVYIRWDGWQEPTRAEAAGFFKNDEKGNAVEFAFDECVDGETIAWWHMSCGRVLGVYDGRLIEYEPLKISSNQVVRICSSRIHL